MCVCVLQERVLYRSYCGERTKRKLKIAKPSLHVDRLDFVRAFARFVVVFVVFVLYLRSRDKFYFL